VNQCTTPLYHKLKTPRPYTRGNFGQDVTRCCFMHFHAKGMSFFFRITCWYLYQSIPFSFLWVTASLALMNFQVGFLSSFFHIFILLISVTSSHFTLAAGSSNALMQVNSSSDFLLFAAVLSFQQWHDPFLSYKNAPQNINSEALFYLTWIQLLLKCC